MEWSKKLVLVGGVAASAAVLLYLCKARKDGAASEDAEIKDQQASSSGHKRVQSEEAAKEQLKDILKELIKAQEQMKTVIKDLTQELQRTPSSLVEICKKIEKVQPPDPMVKHGLQLMDLDKLLEKHQQDTEIRNSIAKIMGAPNPHNIASEKIQSISVKDVIEYHKFMLQELTTLIDEYENLPPGERQALDPKTVTIAAQVVVGARFEQEHQVSSEDVETAVLMYHANLATDQTFASVNIQIQHAMSRLMGTPMAPS
ncbi:Hypothetical protein SCF082_LOCUS47015 [Durusdinium trenchii]|uniref:Uncharacterized protein n=1 Tax=Durusdinium trenchii TaxID=1381693 RepID=A0ABP0RIN2_9DINO